MKILNNAKKPKLLDCVLTVGNFDGVHRAHREIIDLMRKISTRSNASSVLITFNPHPSQFFHNEKKEYLITSLNKKVELLKSLNVDYLYVANFDKRFSNISADNFIKNFLCKKFSPKDIIIGYDHCFGKNREGTFELFEDYQEELGFNLHRVDSITLENTNIKSSAIRDCIREGNVEKGSQLLGRLFSFQGEVVRGRGKGKALSFPTANIKPEDNYQILPANGVYSTDLIIKKNKKRYNSVCNIGVRPTFKDGYDKKSIEVHILSNDIFDIYDYEVELIFKSRIRDEIKFSSEKELINQINLDKEYCINN